MYNLPGDRTMEEAEGILGERLRSSFSLFRDGAMIDKSEKWILPTNYLKFANFIYKFSYHSSDVIINTFPKSGTTWVQEIVWTLLHNPNLDNPEAKLSIDARSPSLHGDMLLASSAVPPPNPEGKLMKRFNMLFPGKDPSDGVLLHLAALNPSPRLIKTHLPLPFLYPDILSCCKLIYVARDPRDVINSLYFFMRLNLLYGFSGTLDEFVDYFLDDKIVFGPYWKHIQTVWELRDNQNVLFLFYEDLVNDIEKQVRKIDKYLGTKRTDAQISNVMKITTLDAMRERNKLNPPSSIGNQYFNQEVRKEQGGFFRKGIVGDWKENFSLDQEKKIVEWMRENMTEFGADFRYNVVSE